MTGGGGGFVVAAPVTTGRGSTVERWSLTGELSLSYARPTADR